MGDVELRFPPVHLLNRWREEEGLSPEEIKAKVVELNRAFNVEVEVEVEEAQPQNGHWKKLSPQRSPNHTKQLTRRIIEMNRTADIADIAKKLGYTRSHLYGLLKRAGVQPIRHTQTIDPKVAFKMYQEEKSLARTAKRLRVGTDRLWRVLKKAGYPTNLGHGQSDGYKKAAELRRQLPEIEVLIELLQTMTAQEVADRYGVQRISVYQSLRKAGWSIRDIRTPDVRELPEAEALVELLKTESAQVVADRYGVSRSMVYYKVRRAGLSIRKGK